MATALDKLKGNWKFLRLLSTINPFLRSAKQAKQCRILQSKGCLLPNLELFTLSQILCWYLFLENEWDKGAKPGSPSLEYTSYLKTKGIRKGCWRRTLKWMNLYTLKSGMNGKRKESRGQWEGGLISNSFLQPQTF